VEQPTDLIRSVSRALRILEAVGDAPEGLSAKVVARRCDLSLSTAYHLLRTLAYEGYLDRLPNGDYAVGLEIADRFRDLAAHLGRPPAVAGVLRSLAGATGFSAFLARFVHERVTITQVVEAPATPPLEDLVPGFDDGAHATALGKALLSTLAQEERRDYVRAAGLRPFTPRTIREVAVLEHEIAEARDGVFAETCQYRPDIGCAAVLVETGDPTDPWWAIALGGEVTSFELRRRELEGALRTAAADLGHAAVGGR
jgi:DNA-binding IclR family transcriptional regulator